MTNTELKQRFDLLLKPIGYKKKGNKWSIRSEQLTKVIELQKSGFSNLYYVNYGINLNQLDYEDVTYHIFNRDNNIFDLEEANDEKLIEMTNQSINQIINNLDPITTIEDVKIFIKKLPTLNLIPLKVKEFLKIKE